MPKSKIVQRTRTANPEAMAREMDRLGWTEDQLAKKTKLDPKTVRRAINGGAVYRRTLAKIANALGVTGEILTDQTKGGSGDGRAFELEVKTCGRIFGQEQFDRLLEITSNLVIQLNRAGVDVVQDSKLFSKRALAGSELLVFKFAGAQRPVDSASLNAGQMALKVADAKRSLLEAPQLPDEPWVYAAIEPGRTDEFIAEFESEAFDPLNFESEFGHYLVVGFGPVWHSEFEAAFAEVTGEHNP